MLCHVFWSQVEYKIVCFISLMCDVNEQYENTKLTCYSLRLYVKMATQTSILRLACDLYFEFKKKNSCYKIKVI